jgi:hypothetical protein
MSDEEVASQARTVLGAPNVGDVIRAYMKLRNMKSNIEAEMKAKVDDLKVKMDKLEGWIKTKADEEGVTSFKTEFGTAFLTTTDYANVADWDSVLNFIQNNGSYDMLEKRVSKTAVRAYIEQYKAVPPGVNYGTKLEVSVRKPAATSE